MSRHLESGAAAGAQGRFRAIFEASPDCIKLVSPDSRLIDINAAGLRMIEADCISQVQGRSLFELIDPAYHQSFRDGVEAVFAGQVTRIQFEVVGLRGRRLFMDQTAAPLFAHDDPTRVLEMVAITRNVSAERQAEATLLQVRLAQEVARSAARHAANLGQKLKTPLDTIIGYSELLLEAAQEHNRARETDDAQRVLDAAAELSALVNQLLQTALSETREQEPAQDVDDLLESLASAARPLAEANGNRIHIEIDPRCASLPPHGDMLAQCLQALIAQAIKHTHDGLITVKARPMLADGPPRMVLSVIDTGAGLSRQQIDTLFETDVRCDETPGAAPSDLAAARNLARFMGGDINVASAPHRGSRFTLTVPVAAGR